MDCKLLEDFQSYANSLGSGFLKEWKADMMINELYAMPEIHKDEVRFLNYLHNCLEMEGFRSIDIELIMGWLYERLTDG